VPGELLEHLTGMIEFYEKELATCCPKLPTTS
jgi:hypothetical protein